MRKRSKHTSFKESSSSESYYIPRLTASSSPSILSASFFICFRFRLRIFSASRNSSASCRILASCSASLLPMPGSTLMRYSICCSFIIRSLANSLCRWANVFDESGRGGRSLFCSCVPPEASPPCCCCCCCCCWGVWSFWSCPCACPEAG